MRFPWKGAQELSLLDVRASSSRSTECSPSTGSKIWFPSPAWRRAIAGEDLFDVVG